MAGYEVRYNNASVRSVCPVCKEVFKPRIGDVLFLGRDPVCDECDTNTVEQVEAEMPNHPSEPCPF